MTTDSQAQYEDKIAKLHTTLGKMELALGSIVEAIVWTDQQGAITWCNESFSQLTGKSSLALLNKPLTESVTLFKGGEALEGAENPLHKLIEEGQTLDERFDVLIGSKRIKAEIHGSCFRYLKGDVNTVLVIRNITQRAQLESQLVQAQKLESIGSLAAGVAHEINTPIQYIQDNLGFLGGEIDGLVTFLKESLQYIAEQADSPTRRKLQEQAQSIDLDFLMEEIPDAVQQGIDGVTRIAEIVRSMKAFSHPGSEDSVQVELNELLQNTITVSRNEWKYAAELTTDFDSALSRISAHPGPLGQAFLNVIVNAAHAIERKQEGTEKRGLIHIQTRNIQQGVQVRIQDSGTGIPDAIKEKIFDPFFTTKGVGEGTGQGLNLAWQTVVEEHHGHIQVESAVGEGTTFIINLPIEENHVCEENYCVVCG